MQTPYTARQIEILDEHVGDFVKDNDRSPDRDELLELMVERMRDEREGSPLYAEFEAIVDLMVKNR